MPGKKSVRVRSRSGYLPSLDGWRAIAIFGVCCTHDTGIRGFGIFRFHEVGWAGVDLFFAISGLLICSRLLEEEQINGRISLRDFYVRRVFRIFPPAYLFIAVALILGLAHQIPYSIPASIAAALMVRNYWGAYSGTLPNEIYTDHFWSLSIEEHFYLILPAVLVFVKRRVLVLSIMTVAVCLWFLHWIKYGRIPGALSGSRTDLRIEELLVPAIFAILLKKPEIRRLALKWVRPWFWIAMTLLAGTALHKLHAGENFLILTVLFPFLVTSTMIHPQSLTTRILEWQPLRYIGRISYGIYLWQQIFLIQRDTVHWPFSILQTFPFNYLGFLACAIASYYLLEKPMIRLGHRLAPPATPGRQDLEPETGKPGKDIAATAAPEVELSPGLNTAIGPTPAID